MSMGMPNLPNLLLVIKGQVADAVHGLKTVKGETGKVSSAFGSLKDAGMIAAGMLARDMVQGLIAATNEAFTLGGQIRTLTNAFTRLISVTGGTELSLDALRKATRGTVADIDLLRAANTAMTLGLPTDELDDLMESAMILGHALGIDTTSAIESLSIGLGRQSRLVLDNLGIVFQAEDAYNWYAGQLGVTANQLTELQKREGWQLYAMEQIRSKASELGDVIDETTIRQEGWSASWKNLTTSIGNFLAPLAAIQPVLNPLMNMVGTTAGILLPRLVSALASTTVAQWALNAATAAWQALQGPVGWAILAGAAIAGVAAYAKLKGGFQFGGVVPETGAYMLHRGETVVPSSSSTDRSVHIHGPITVVTSSPSDFVRKMRALGVGY